MKNSYEIIKFVFDDSKVIVNNSTSWEFLEQMINADIEKIKLDVDKNNVLIKFKDGIWNDGLWKYGLWEDSKWKDGVWYYGDWMNGEWYKGIWHNGYWNDGYWYSGKWLNGVWKRGYWKDGIWKNGVWVKGKIYNPKTKQYEYSKVPPNKCEWSLSYGK